MDGDEREGPLRRHQPRRPRGRRHRRGARLLRAAPRLRAARQDPGRGLDFLDPWGNRIQVVQYDEIQFTKTDAALRKLGADGIGKTAKAEAEMRERGLL
jgi:hypothetical protein